MKVIILFALVVVTGVLIMKQHTFFDAGGGKATQGKASDSKTGKGDGDGKKDEPKVVFTYCFDNRPVPEALGEGAVIDKGSNSVTVICPVSERDSRIGSLKARDVPLHRCKVQVDIVELSSDDDSGYSISAALSQWKLNLSLPSAVAVTASPAIGAMGLAWDKLSGILAQGSFKVRAKLKMHTEATLTHGVETAFNQYSEQITTNATTTTTATTTNTERRKIGLIVKMTPCILTEGISLSYLLSNSQADTNETAVGADVVGECGLTPVPQVLVDSIKTRVQDQENRFLWVPVGKEHVRQTFQDVVTVTLMEVDGEPVRKGETVQ